MFENPGGKIKAASILMFWLVAITSVILAFVLGIEKSGYGYYARTEFNAAIFFGFLIGGPLVAYISTLFLVGFGELVENSELVLASQLKQQETMKAHAMIANSDDTIPSTPNNSLKVHPQSSAAQKNKNKRIHKCQNCGMMVSVNPCPKCGFDNPQEATDTVRLFKCPKCQKISKTIPCSHCGYDATEFD